MNGALQKAYGSLVVIKKRDIGKIVFFIGNMAELKFKRFPQIANISHNIVLVVQCSLVYPGVTFQKAFCESMALCGGTRGTLLLMVSAAGVGLV